MVKVKVWALLAVLLSLVLLQAAYAQESLLERGIAEYNKENYEAALPHLEGAYKENKSDFKTLSYLGFTQRELNNNAEAARYFKEALAIDPKAGELQYLLADALYRLGKYEDALGVIESSRQDVLQPQFNLLKGETCLKLGKRAEALTALNKAKELDPALESQADYYAALGAAQGGDNGKAEETFRRIIASDPNSDWALLSQDYLKTLEQEKAPYRFSARVGLQYDDNVLAVPIYQSLVTVEKQADWKALFAFSGEYLFNRKGRWNVKASYGLNAGIYNESSYPKNAAGNRIFSPNTLSHTVSLTPSYNTESSVTALALSYDYLDVDYVKYLQTLSISPSYTALLSEGHLVQVFASYKQEDQNEGFYPRKLGFSLIPQENRDANNISGGGGYFHLFSKNKGLFSIKAEGYVNNAEGQNWDYAGARIASGLFYPLSGKITAGLYAEVAKKDFSNVNSVYNLKRSDDVRAGQASLAYALNDDLDLSAQYARLRNKSNIGFYDYRKNLYTVTLDYRF